MPSYKCSLIYKKTFHHDLLFPIWPHCGGEGSSRSPVWNSHSANSGWGVRIPAAAACVPKSRHRHPGAGKNVQKRWEFHPHFLLSHLAIQTHLCFSGLFTILKGVLASYKKRIVFQNRRFTSQLLFTTLFLPAGGGRGGHTEGQRRWAGQGVSHCCGSVCQQWPHDSREGTALLQIGWDVTVGMFLLIKGELWCLCIFPAMDADLRFALERRLESDIIRPCVVYVHSIINSKGQRPKMPINSETIAPLEVIHNFFIGTCKWKGT